MIALLGLQTFYWFWRKDPLDTHLILFQAQWIFYIILVSINISEQVEEKSKGYKFLETLPVTDSEIVRSKFMIILIIVCFLVIYNNVLYLFKPGPSYLFNLGRYFIPVAASITLFCAALLYVLRFKLGFSKFIKIGWIIAIGGVIGPFLFIEFVLLKINMDLDQFVLFLSEQHWILWGLVFFIGLILFFFLMSMAVQSKKIKKD